MIAPLALVALLSLAAPADTSPPPAVFVPAVPVTVRAPVDTERRRRRPMAVFHDDAYYTRLTIHRDLSYAMYPLYALQYVCGQELWSKSRDAPTWAKTGHRVGATLLVGVFGVNTVTGVWNLWDDRDNPDGRVLRTVHAVTMLAADAALSYAGGSLANQAQNSLVKRREHLAITISAMGLTTLSGLMMTFFNH